MKTIKLYGDMGKRFGREFENGFYTLFNLAEIAHDGGKRKFLRAEKGRMALEQQPHR